MNKEDDNLTSLAIGKLLLFQTLWDNTSDNMFIVKVDENGDFISESCNSSLEKTFSATTGSLNGIRLKDVLEQSAYDFIAEKYNQCITLKKPITYDENIVLKDNKRYFNTTILPIIEDQSIRIFGISREMTELVKKEQEKLIIEQLKNAQIRDMIGNIAHQWFQPLSTISTAASGIKLDKSMGITNEDKELVALDSIIENTQYLSSIIDTFKHNIIDNKEYQNVILQERITYAIKRIESSLENNKIDLIYDLNKELKPINIQTIKGEISDVITYMINNSKDALLKNKPLNPFIKISLEQDQKTIKIKIEDNGGGIKKEILPKIFDLYFSTKHKAQGIGLSLFMCKRIIEEHLQGQISVNNTKNGAVFTIELPLL